MHPYFQWIGGIMGNKRPGTKGCYFYLTDKTAQMITANMTTADARTRSEFVEKAIEQYCCSLNAETSKDILSYEVTRAIKAAVKDSECRLCNYLFKLCGEMGLLSYLVGADLINMTDEEINQCRRKAFDVVRRERGMLKLEDVVKDERAIAESDY